MRASAIALVVAAAFAGAAQAAQTSSRCNRHRAVRKDAAALVFRAKTNRDDLFGHRLTAYYACARPNGRAVQLALDSSPGDAEYPPDYELTALRLAGGYAGAVVIVGQASLVACLKFGSDCPTPHTKLTLVDAKARSKATVFPPNGTKSLTLSPAGAAAWLAPAASGGSQLMATVLRPQGRKLQLAPQQLDTGRITGLRFNGRTLSWRNGGAPRSATLSAR